MIIKKSKKPTKRGNESRRVREKEKVHLKIQMKEMKII